MTDENKLSEAPHLIWIFPGPLDEALDSATWLETTRELREMDWVVTLIHAAPWGLREVQSVDVMGIPTSQIYFLRQLIFHLRIIRFLVANRDETDMVMFHSISGPWILPLKVFGLIPRLQRPLFVMDTRDLHPVGGNLKDALRRKFIRFAHWLANKYADGQTAITQKMVELVDISPEHLWGIWPSGVIPDKFHQSHQNRIWPKAVDPIHLIYIGRLLEERNLLALSEAIVQSNSEGMRFNLRLVGDGPIQDRLDEVAKGSNGSIKLVAPVPHEQIPLLLAQAHIGVTSLPSPQDVKYAASSPIKLFEYMAAGLPVLATRNRCHTDVVGDGRYVFWIENEQTQTILASLRSAWKERSSLSYMGGEAIKSVQSWTWESAASKLDIALRNGLSIRNFSPTGIIGE